MITLSEYYNLYPVAANRRDIDRQIKQMKKPEYICGKEIADTALNTMSIGNYALLTSVRSDFELVQITEKVLDLQGLLSERADNALALLHWVVMSMKKIAELFAKAGKQVGASTEELNAGVKSLPSDIFTLIDWFAKRMHTTHDVAETTSWQIVYKCYNIDMAAAAYERKLRKQYEQKQQQAKKGRKR